MALSVVDLYRSVLPKTNCRACGFSTCLAFASMVVSEKLPLDRCPHIDPETLLKCQAELDAQHAAGKWTRRDLAADALSWAKERAASMDLGALPGRIGGELVRTGKGERLRLAYFSDWIWIGPDGIEKADGSPVTRWEQVFIYNHLAQGGSAPPTGNWKGLEAFPNTVSKMKSMRSSVEEPLVAGFSGKGALLKERALKLGAVDMTAEHGQADAALRFSPFPRVPVLLLFWDADPVDGFDARVKLLFDETVTEHLDIESILFMSERIRQLLLGEGA